MYAFDFAILNFVYEHLHCPILDTFFSYITHLGDAGILWILLAIVLLIFKRTRPLGISISIALILDLICCNLILKPLVARIRPYNYPGYEFMRDLLLVKAPTDYSFPSGHTAASFAATSALFFKKSKLWIPALVLSIIIAFSRIYLFVHYPTDVFAGLIIGIVVGLAGAVIEKRLERKLQAKNII
jgi:undecaprenyl-diphosphatase